MTGRKLPPDTAYMVQAADRHQHLLAALTQLLEAAGNLDAAIDGVTTQFDHERKRLQDAIQRADGAMLGLKRGAP